MEADHEGERVEASSSREFDLLTFEDLLGIQGLGSLGGRTSAKQACASWDWEPEDSKSPLLRARGAEDALLGRAGGLSDGRASACPRRQGLERSSTAEFGLSKRSDTGFGSDMLAAERSSPTMAWSSSTPLTAHILSPGLMGSGSPAPDHAFIAFLASQEFHCDTGVACASPVSMLLTDRSMASPARLTSRPKRVNGLWAAKGFALAPGSERLASKLLVVWTKSPRTRSNRAWAGDESSREGEGEARPMEAGERTIGSPESAHHRARHPHANVWRQGGWPPTPLLRPP